MGKVKYPYQCNTCKSAVVLATSTADMIFSQLNMQKYRVLMCGCGNMSKERRYTIFSDKLHKVIDYMQGRTNAFAQRSRPEMIEVYIFKDKIDFDQQFKYVYHWSYKPTYRD